MAIVTCFLTLLEILVNERDVLHLFINWEWRLAWRSNWFWTQLCTQSAIVHGDAPLASWIRSKPAGKQGKRRGDVDGEYGTMASERR